MSNSIERRLKKLNACLPDDCKIQRNLKEPAKPDHSKHPKFWRILEVQQGKCAICQTDLTPSNYTDVYLCQGQPLGILCKSCNVGLVSFQDNQSLLEKAWSFLQRKKEPPKELEQYFKL